MSCAEFIDRRYEHMLLTYALDPHVERTVDENGRPVIRWRPVDDDGNDSIPEGETEGVLWYCNEDDLYHSWNFILVAIYTHWKSFAEIEEDIQTFYDIYSEELHFKKIEHFSFPDIEILF